MRTQLLTPFINVSAGQTFQVQVEVYNTGALIDGVVGRLVGVDPTWVQGGGQTVSLFPDTSEILTLEVTLPREYPAGQHTLVVEVRSNVDDSDGAVHQVRLEIQPRERVRMKVRPQVLVAGRKGTATVAISNIGNQPVELQISAADAERLVDCQVAPSDLLVRPGHEMETKLALLGRRPLFGGRADRQVTVVADGASDELTALMTFRQKPWITRGLLTALTLVFIVALWAVIFTFGVSALIDDKTPQKALPGGSALAFVLDDANADGIKDGGGSGDLSAADIGGTITGSARAETTDEGLARITVEAYRQGRNGPVLAGSVATDEGGAFELASLLPGNYRIRYTGEGFIEEWFPDSPAEGGALVLTLDPVGEINLDELPDPADPGEVIEGGLLEGEPGIIRGTVLADSNEEQPPAIAITARALFAGEADEVAVEADAAGGYALTGLLTPGQYELTVSSADFRPETFLVSLAGGESQIVNTVKLVAADGFIGGLVTGVIEGNVTPLGGVEVTITQGEFEATTTTPTEGGVGTYLFSELETPGTYVLTFALDGFSTQVISLALEPGGRELDVGATLTQGSGELRGVVRRDDTKAALGGATVTVTGSDFTASTLTLTGDGSYTITGIPTPGDYTVTFSLTGFSTETRAFSLTADAVATPLDAALKRTIGTIKGKVLTGSLAPVGEVQLSLTDGLVIREVIGSTPLDATGSAFTFSGLAPGSYTVTATSSGFVPENRLVQLTPGQTVDLAIDLVGSGSLRGFVKNATAAAPGLTVALQGLTGAATTISTSVPTDGQGVYSFGALPPGTYTITVTGGDTVQVRTIVITSGQTVAPTIDVGLGSLLVTVELDPTSAVHTVNIDVAASGQTTQSFTITGEGSHTFTDLVPASYTITATDTSVGNRGSSTIVVPVVPGPNTAPTITVGPPAP